MGLPGPRIGMRPRGKPEAGACGIVTMAERETTAASRDTR